MRERGFTRLNVGKRALEISINLITNSNKIHVLSSPIVFMLRVYSYLYVHYVDVSVCLCACTRVFVSMIFIYFFFRVILRDHHHGADISFMLLYDLIYLSCQKNEM